MRNNEKAERRATLKLIVTLLKGCSTQKLRDVLAYILRI